MRQKVANQIQKMTQELQNVLRPTRAAKWKDGYTSGSKVNLKRMIQRGAKSRRSRFLAAKDTGFKT